MALHSRRLWLLWLDFAALTLSQQCYFGAGAKYKVPTEVGLVPCLSNGYSSCCKLGDTCLSGGACFNEQTGDTYQYGCNDVTYQDASCPYKCGWDVEKSPWVGLEYCQDGGYTDTWVCHSPESCGCEWRATWDLLLLQPRQCQEMGSLARVAIYAPDSLQAYASLPKTMGGSTGYFKPGTTTPIDGYAPASIGPASFATPPPTSVVQLDAAATPDPSSVGPAVLPNGSLPPIPDIPTYISSSSSAGAPTSSSAGVITPAAGTSKKRSSTRTSPNNAGPSTGSGTSSSGSTTAGGGSGTGPGSSGSSQSPTSSPSGGRGGLSTGAKVGLGVGIAGGVLAIAAIVAVVVLRRRKQRISGEDPDYRQGYNEKHTSYESAASASYYDPPGGYRGTASPGLHEAPYTPVDEQTIRKRMSPQGPAELDASSSIHEMESHNATPTLYPSSPNPRSESPRFSPDPRSESPRFR